MSNHTVDIAALAQLRPGMPVSRLSEALGSYWRPLTAEDEGWVKTAGVIENGFSARVDVHGVIGMLCVSARFPKALTMERLQIGMTLQEVTAEYPSLAHTQDIAGTTQTMKLYNASAADGMQLTALFREGLLLGYHLFNPDAIYVSEVPVLAPFDHAVSAPFFDPNFKLVVLDALLSEGSIDLGSSPEFLSRALRRPYDPRQDGQWPSKCKPAYDYLVHMPLTSEQLASVTSLCCDAGNTIYDYIWPGWSGETDDFDVRSLNGIELLTNLRDFNDIALLDVDDLSPLANLHHLRSLDLGLGTKLPAEILLALSGLEKFACHQDDAPDAKALEALARRGVDIRLY